MKTFVTISLFAVVLGQPLQAWGAPLVTPTANAGSVVPYQLLRRSPMNPNFYRDGATDGVDDDSSDDVSLSNSSMSNDSQSTEMESDNDEDIIPIPFSPEQFYDNGYPNAVRTHFVAQPNVRQVITHLIEAYQIVGQPGTYPVMHYLQSALQAGLWNVVGDAGANRAAYHHARVLWHFIVLLNRQAEQAGDQHAVEFFRQAIMVLRSVSDGLLQSIMDNLPVQYERRPNWVAPATFLRNHIQQVGLGINAADDPELDAALDELADTLHNTGFGPLEASSFMNNLHSRRAQALFANIPPQPAVNE
ncbi:hypothetical protein H4R34_003282 [Dimargaris verticillata]|uniref:Secreted protein n=1 Tax=Dimargaris verticillata TaxID=2761393 RepID=A0A9W8B0A0_9FUNG|nr:hypothetical protein H4R34_003282 [Dimargaris verticillata]